MKSILTYIRNLLGYADDTPPIERPSSKRGRNGWSDEDISLDVSTPASKKRRQLLKTVYPEAMSSNGGDTNGWDKEVNSSKVRYVPIIVESSHPSTSTPNDGSAKFASRARTLPSHSPLDGKHNGPATPTRKPRIHTPVAYPDTVVLEDDDDDDDEVQIVQAKPETKKKSKLYINLDDEQIKQIENDDDVVFVKKISTPPPPKPIRYFLVDDSEDVTDDVPKEPVYYKLQKVNNNNAISPRSNNKFVAPPGISKSYKKPPIMLSKWMQSSKPTNLVRNKYFGLNGNTRTSLSEIFNLEEKKNYQVLIKKVAASMKSSSHSKPVQIVNLSQDKTGLRNIKNQQNKVLHETNLVKKELLAEKENKSSKEYDPITVASINSSDSEADIVPSEASTSSSVRIKPLNTFKDSLRHSAVASGDWVNKIGSKYKKKKLMNQEKLKDISLEDRLTYKVNSEQKIAHLEHKIKNFLNISESLFEEKESTLELPALTPEQEKLVNRALGPGPPGDLLAEKFNLRIHRRDLQTLCGLNWLNDEVINFYMNLVMQRSQRRPALPRVYAANTFFYPKLLQGGQPGLRRWTRKVDIFSHDLMVVPVHLGVHWCLSLVEFGRKRISYLDSMGGRNQRCLDLLLQYLRDEHQDKKGAPFDDAGWTTECLKDIPQQMNGSDCGMFACTFAEFSSRGAPFTFNQSHMPYLRRKAALEILTGELLL